MSYTLRPYQSESCNATWNYLCNQQGNPVIDLPTGAGKSLVIAELARKAVQQYQGRAIVLAHRAELLSQNAEKIKALLPFGVTCGIYSAGLRRFALDDHIICCGIQSVYKKAADFGRRHLVIIDEAHLVPDDNEGMYHRFLSELSELNPKLKIVGLTATPYRTTTGTVCGEGKLFSSICYKAKIPALIADGYLCPVISETTKEIYDTSNLHIRGGEFIAREVEMLFDDDGKTLEACKEIIQFCIARKSILIFSSGIQHAEHIQNIISSLTGEQCESITGNTPQLMREGTLKAFKDQRLRWLVNVDVLTTGFDAPCVDAIAVLRATQSPGLFAQICGRGFRLHPNKQNCLIIDYGNNVKRHGSIDSDSYGQKRFTAPREQQENNEPSENKKQCPACEKWFPAGLKVCECGWLFAKIDANADTQTPILTKPEKWRVVSIHLSRHIKKKTVSESTPDTLRVSYEVTRFDSDSTGDLSTKEISEWVCLEHEGFAGKKALQWLSKMTTANIREEMQLSGLSRIDTAIDLFNRGAFAPVYSITTVKDGRWDKITDREIGERPTIWQQPRDIGEAVGFDEWGEPIFEEEPQPASEYSEEDLPF